MSYCTLKTDSSSKLPKLAFELDLQLVLRGVTAQFVSKDQYKQLLFILGMKPNSSTGSQQTYMEVLELFKEINTNSSDSFQDMLGALEFPFVYNKKKSIAQNRRDFKDFFSYLTNIRCAIVEGSHRCEAACRMLQGYLLGEELPLEYCAIHIPPTSTLFKLMGIQVYHCQDAHPKLNNNVLKELQGKSQKVAEQKELVVQETWHNFFSKVYDDIVNDIELKQVLYKTQEDFYLEDVNYDNISKLDVQSNQIKMCLHKILTKAIFEYCPCKDLLNLIRKGKKPKPEV